MSHCGEETKLGREEESCRGIGGWDAKALARCEGSAKLCTNVKFFCFFLCRAPFSWLAALKVAQRQRSAAEESAAPKHQELQAEKNIKNIVTLKEGKFTMSLDLQCKSLDSLLSPEEVLLRGRGKWLLLS